MLMICDLQDNENDEDDDDEEESLVKVVEDVTLKTKRLEKKQRLKERFDTEYDDGDATYFDDLKEELQKQAEVLRICYSHISYIGQRFVMLNIYVRISLCLPSAEQGGVSGCGR